MKKLLIELLTFGSLSVYAQDPGVGTSSEQFKAELVEKFEGLKRAMEIQISERNLDFSDYHAASKDLLNKIDRS